MNRKQIDFTTGPIGKALLLYFLPVLAGGLFQQLYATVDAVILAQFAGKAGLAAMDSIYNLLKLPVNFFVGLSTGATIIISQYFGARNVERLGRAVHTAAAFSLAGGAALSALCVLAAPWGLRLMGVPEDIFPLTLTYVRVYFGGFAASMAYNIGAGILRAVGDSKTPFAILAASGGVNVLLDLLFVAVLRMSAPGAALATVLAQCVSAVLAFRALCRAEGACRLSLKGLCFDRPALGRIFTIGLPIALQSALYPIANMTVQTTVNQTGTDNIVAWALCGKLDFLIWLAADSLGAAVSTFVAQNVGAGQIQRARRGTRVGLGLALGAVLAVSAVLFFWSEPLGRLILNPGDAPLAAVTGRLMRLMAPLYFLYAFGEVYGGSLRGAGESLAPMAVTLSGTCATRVLWIFFFPHGHSLLKVLAVYPVSWAACSLGMAACYHHYWKRKERVS